MIVGCYTTDLYCRNAAVSKPTGEATTCARTEYKANDAGQYTGETYRQTVAKAKKDGWRFDEDGEVTCPWCVKHQQANPRKRRRAAT